MTYSIGEFAKIVGVTTSTLRYYEKEGLLTPHRNENNLREFTDHDIRWVQFLLHLKGSGMSMTELKQYTKWRAMGEATIPERLDLLEKRKRLVEQEMLALQQNLDILNRKVEFYEDQLKGNKYEFVLYPNEEV
ncbi:MULTISPECIES: MerR family transcriptional regulator [Bacillus]|uniref:MerR family transcriptional regulator n=2 Tax=Bacillus TaxID=1386 RepID=A0A0M4FQ49_9BACI|nr:MULTISPECIES: MerR family transcriptional regulator [Bacillus]ALC81209.1 MerR family transcriptional regulator [Bacillus gobiensis]MBP1080193.1 DNA-binding transcriptional MerR regulator [Bacillus capparidis]MED1094066.1 MerR family transcriptional regulator [Bacillus capparidis]